MYIFGKHITKKEILKRVGDISQICDIRLSTLKEGIESGVNIADIKTGSGLNFTVIIDRGMDIGYASYKDIPFAWLSPTGYIHPSFFEPSSFGWLRSFFGGLLTSCGLTFLGAPCIDEGKALGLHGRISNIPAKNVSVNKYWQKDDYIMEITGEIKEVCVFGENILLKRKIKTKLGEKKIWINDTVKNLGFKETPHMILYHINIGYPVIDKETVLLSPAKKIIPRDDEAEKGKESFNKFHSPVKGYREKVYYHIMKPDKNGNVNVKIKNQKLKIGINIKYNYNELPEFIEWKMMGEGEYVVGLEPANCRVEGRVKERGEGRLKYLKPGEIKKYNIEIGII